MRLFGSLRTLALVALVLSSRAPTGSAAWKEYVNPRFAFRACYPDWLKAGRESDNGDGRIFTDKFGGEMRVWGSYGTLVLINGKEEMSDDAPAETVIRQASDYEAGSLSRITYRTVRHNWYALSGRSKGKTVYLKTVLADDRWITLRLTYPISTAHQWNPVVKHIASCLQALPLETATDI